MRVGTAAAAAWPGAGPWAGAAAPRPPRPFLLPLLLPEATLTRRFPSTWASFSCKAWPSDGHLGFCFLVWCAARSQVEECKSDKTE